MTQGCFGKMAAETMPAAGSWEAGRLRHAAESERLLHTQTVLFQVCVLVFTFPVCVLLFSRDQSGVNATRAAMYRHWDVWFRLDRQ